jgi:xylulokinase
MDYLIGLDIGTSGLKALLLRGGAIVGGAKAPYHPDYSGGGRVEQDPDVWWDAAKRAIKELIAAHPQARGNVAAIAASGQMHSSVFLDKSGAVIRKAILWNDTRTTAQTAHIRAAVGERHMLEYVQNRPLEGFTLPKILWLRDNEPENFAKTDKVVMPKDYVNYRLTGVLATDFSDAAGTAAFNVKERAWSGPLLEALGLDAGIFPGALESTGSVGFVMPDTAAELGLSPDTKVIAGGADNSCAAIGNGVTRAGQAVISVGTSGTVVAMLDKIEARITGDVHLFNYSYPGAFYAMGCMLSAGACLDWYRGVSGTETFAEVSALAGAAPKGGGGVTFLPYLAGERCPFSDPAARGVFFGLSHTTGKAEMARAVMEGAAYNIRAMLELVAGFTDVNEVYITGGGAKSGVWGQIIADICGRRLDVLNIEEGPAFGAALIAGVGAGVFEGFDAAKNALLKTERSIEPNADDIYEKGYGLFRRLYAANKELFKERAF